MREQIVTGKTRIAGIIGNPVKHSFSPVLHNHLFRELKLPYIYIPMGVEREKLDMLIDTLRSLNGIGANVTIPYKTDVVKYCDEISSLSKLTGTVNTLYFKEEKLCGTTTDYVGFSEAIKEAGGVISESDVVIMGNGGTARTIAIAMADEGLPSSISIVGRDIDKVKKLANEVSKKSQFPIDVATFNDEYVTDIFNRCDVLINCTPVGMEPNTEASPLNEKYLHAGMFVFDAIYNPAKTQLLKDAEILGCRTENGLAMLLYQGLASFKYWTGITPEKTLVTPNQLLEVMEKSRS